MAGIAQSLPSWLGPAMSAGSTVLTAGSQIAGGINARRSADIQAGQADTAAGQVEAASQRTAADQERRATLLGSRAQALAAASGGGASDPTVVDLISRIAGEGQYRSQLALYEGRDAARTLRTRGDIARYEGKASERAGYLSAIGTVLKGGSSLFEKYGKRPASGGVQRSDLGGVDSYFDDAGWGMT